MKTLSQNDAMVVKCCYCEAKATCPRRSRKEQYEKAGLMTYCTLTPNRLRVKSKKQKSKRRVKKPISLT